MQLQDECLRSPRIADNLGIAYYFAYFRKVLGIGIGNSHLARKRLFFNMWWGQSLEFLGFGALNLPLAPVRTTRGQEAMYSRHSPLAAIQATFPVVSYQGRQSASSHTGILGLNPKGSWLIGTCDSLITIRAYFFQLPIQARHVLLMLPADMT